jgi:hypothetical protein
VGFCGGQSGTGQVFSEYFGFPCKYIIPPLLHIHLSPPHEVCDRSDQAAHYHNLGPQLWASLLTRHIGWKQKQKVKKKALFITRSSQLLKFPPLPENNLAGFPHFFIPKVETKAYDSAYHISPVKNKWLFIINIINIFHCNIQIILLYRC